MSSAGHVMDMIRRIKANRELLKAKHSRHAKIKAWHASQIQGNLSASPIDPLSGEELADIRNEIIGKLRLQQRRNLFKTIAIGMVILGLIAWLMIRLFWK